MSRSVVLAGSRYTSKVGQRSSTSHFVTSSQTPLLHSSIRTPQVLPSSINILKARAVRSPLQYQTHSKAKCQSVYPQQIAVTRFTTMSPASTPPTTAALATTFRSLHNPSHPLILTNVHDAPSARAVASLPATTALATASYAVAVAAGLEDAELSLEANLAAVRPIAAIAKEHNLPLTVDFQDGYGDQLEKGVGALLDLGVVGINLEDRDKDTGAMMSLAVAAERVNRVVAVAKRRGVNDFVVNARCDTLIVGGAIDEVIERGKAYLAAGATTVFVWGGTQRGGITRAEVKELATAFEGRLNASLRLPGKAAGFLTVKELTEIGVARISIGPQLQLAAMKALTEEAEKLLASRSA